MRVLSGDLSYSIRYDVEHDLFHAQNVFNDEYIKPTFVEYVQKIETENAELKKDLKSKDLALEDFAKWSDKQLTEAKKIIDNLYAICKDNHYPNRSVLMEQAERFLKE